MRIAAATWAGVATGTGAGLAFGCVVLPEWPDLVPDFRERVEVEAGVLDLADAGLVVEEAGIVRVWPTAGLDWPGMVGGRPKAWLRSTAGTAAFALAAARPRLTAAAASCWATLWL